MTVFDLIKALNSFARSAPQNGKAEVVLRAVDGETCFPIHSALNGSGMPGQHFLIFVPGETGAFKMLDIMKVT